MGKLILKIFLCYWVAAYIVIFGADFGPHEQMHRPEVTGALVSALTLHGRDVLQTYEEKGCSAVQPLLANGVDALSIVSRDGEILCASQALAVSGLLISRAIHSDVPVSMSHRTYQVVAFAMKSPSGKPYVLLMRSRFLSPFLGLVPGTTTFIISAVVTLLLAILVAVPIRHLRFTARDIANGQLGSRVRWGKLTSRFSRVVRSDSIHDLVVDFNHMAERLESLVDAQRMLFRDVSHELRSPLARLSVALELAREVGSPSMKAPLDRIEDEAARLNDLIGQLLSLSYMETLQELRQSANLSLADLVTCMMPDIEYEAVGRQRQVVARTLDDCQVMGDALLLQRAFENVVRNAIRYTPERGLVEIEVEKVLRNGAWLAVLRIGDNGPGVPADELKSILRPFHRVDKSRQRSTGGFGVGLAIADRAVKLHSGEIVVWNRPEGGLVVEMLFPLA